MADARTRPPRLAVLIDGDNASPRIADALMTAVDAIGDARVRRVYGDFGGTRLKGWVEAAAAHGLLAVQACAAPSRKNASDIALVIDGMDLLHAGQCDGFCLVSSDGDFTRLALRMREQGIPVYGFGCDKAPERFRQACDRFAVLTPAPAPVSGASGTPPVPKGAASAQTGQAGGAASPEAAVPLIDAAIAQSDGENSWHSLSAIGTKLRIVDPQFDQRRFGHAQLAKLVAASRAFEIRRDKMGVYVRPAPRAAG